MATSDIYNYALKSPSKNPGFVIFEDKEQHEFYFHCNDIFGAPFLYSQAYQNENSANRGLKSVIKNANKDARYKIIQEGKQLRFILKAGNQHEIARSSLFKNKDEIDEIIAFLKRVTNSKTPLTADPRTKPAENPAPAATEAKVKASAAKVKVNEVRNTEKAEIKQPNRNAFSFQLDFFQEEDSDELTGLIRNLSNDAKKELQGVDDENIAKFITDNLPIQSSKVNFSKLKKSLENQIMAKLKIKGKSGNQFLIEKDTNVIECELSLEKEIKKAYDLNDFETKAQVLSMVSGNKITLSLKDMRLSKQGQLNFSIPIVGLPNGVYRLSAQVNNQIDTGIYGSCYLNII